MSAAISIKPGDVTVNYLLAFFSLLVAPLLSWETTLRPYEHATWFAKAIAIFLTVTTSFCLLLRTAPGCRLVLRLVTLVKDTEL